MKIRAAVTRANHAPMSIETLTIEGPRDDEILVRLVATEFVTPSRCAIKPGSGQQPIVLGHEGAGIVERIGKVCHEGRRG